MKKIIKYTLFALFVLGVFVFFLKEDIINYLLEKKSIQNFSVKHNEWLSDRKVHVFIIGSGSPAPSPDQAQACVGIIYQNEFIILDAGAGSARKAETLGLPMKNVSKAFISHFHSDHIMDLDVWSDISWRSGRKVALQIYGTSEIVKIVSGFNQTLSPDASYRSKNISTTADTSTSFSVAKPFEIPTADSLKLVYNNAQTGLKVYAFNVSHQPVEPALGYRIEANGKVIVYSGDTKKDDRMIHYAQNADLLIHESYNKDVMKRALAFGEKIDPQNQNKELLEQAKRTFHYHTDPKEAAEIAEVARVKHLVFTHMIPPIPGGVVGWVLKHEFLKGVAEKYHGKFDIAHDGLHIVL